MLSIFFKQVTYIIIYATHAASPLFIFNSFIDWPIFSYGIIHILRNHQGGRGFRNDYANVIFALYNAEFDYGRGEGV